MPALNFDVFPNEVESGEIRQTIRRVWKRPIKPGDTLYLYAGMRTKRCRKLRTAVCTGVYPVRIVPMCFQTPTGKPYDRDLTADDIAKLDGFLSWPEMRDWFKKRYGLPFEGVLITW